MAYNKEEIMAKWKPVLESADAAPIKDEYRKFVTATLLENQERFLATDASGFGLMNEAAHANNAGSYPDAGGIAKYDPVLISLVRRAMPQLIAYDICSVQPMTLPTGLIFAMKSRYTAMDGTEALYNEADSDFAGTGTHAGDNPVNGTYTTGTGMSTPSAEALGTSGGGTFNQMAMSIERVAVEAKTRALKAEYTQEIAQDMKAVHGLDAEQELASILQTEIVSEINREIIRTIYTSARIGAKAGTATVGTFDLDVDANGRWSVEKFKGLLFQIEREANVIAQQTRRGRGNFILCSSDVASALAMAGVLDYAPALSTNLNVDEASSTFAGVLNGKYKVYVDPYAANTNDANQFALVGYKGASPYDAGVYYCPYVPLQMVRAIDPNSFQPKIAFKTRYGLVPHPMTTLDAGNGNTGFTADKNYYFRKIKVTNLM